MHSVVLDIRKKGFRKYGSHCYIDRKKVIWKRFWQKQYSITKTKRIYMQYRHRKNRFGSVYRYGLVQVLNTLSTTVFTASDTELCKHNWKWTAWIISFTYCAEFPVSRFSWNRRIKVGPQLQCILGKDASTNAINQWPKDLCTSVLAHVCTYVHLCDVLWTSFSIIPLKGSEWISQAYCLGANIRYVSEANIRYVFEVLWLFSKLWLKIFTVSWQTI